MNKLFVVIGLAILSASLIYLKETQQQQDDVVPPEVLKSFNAWKIENGKKYGSVEESYRVQVFYDNYQTIESHNADPTQTYTLGQNKFMDLTKTEFISIYLIQEPEEEVETIGSIQEATSRILQSNDSVDWRDQVIVKDQGQCGSCWAFGTTGAVEAYYKFVLGQSVSLSEQQLVDCSTQNSGCNGGLAPYALDYVTANGLVSEDDYPYKAVDGKCQKVSGTAYKINGKLPIAGTSEGVQAALRKYPVSISVDASNWALYQGGIFSNCGLNTNHAVLAVGFDESGNWIVRNSWSTKWGEQGFIRLAPGNTCNIFKRPHQAI